MRLREVKEAEFINTWVEILITNILLFSTVQSNVH